jgi:hypothetical protein
MKSTPGPGVTARIKLAARNAVNTEDGGKGKTAF